ncbi:tubulin binding cofactor A [Thelonectria olida]|uniref:Tubulin-specific chaperone A n=1 Tax=Thelonectria olida TaxID=1576542 RepID=A0A9P8WIE6_9HYPO|nr:tubulin binding cofactor A [Thelonectria olida]
MPPPSQLAIATSSVNRLLKDVASYHKELVEQEGQVRALEEKIKNGQNDDDGNASFMLKQQKTAVEQTKAVFSTLQDRIEAAASKLEDQIKLREESGAPEQELEAAKETLAKAKAEQNGSS